MFRYLRVWGPPLLFLSRTMTGSARRGPGACCHDSTLKISGLPAADYTLARSAFDNFSFAENFGSGTQGDSFIGPGELFRPSERNREVADLCCGSDFDPL